MRLFAAVAIALVSITPAMAEPETPAQQQEAAKTSGEKVRCKRLDDENTGSNMKRWKKVCKTVAEWEAEERELERQLNNRRSGG